MPWKIAHIEKETYTHFERNLKNENLLGGNFEMVTTKCETNWKECAIAIANYIWCEMVSDVVDYLGKEGMIWVLIVAITSTILLRVKYRRNTRMQNIILCKQILSKVEYKVHDLELKVNILIYKMQYGTWPLPHQIYNLDSKKLQKIRMTLSNPGDHKSWINHMLISPIKSSMCVPYLNIFNSSKAKLTNFSDVKGKRAACHVENNITNCSSIEMLRPTMNDQSMKNSVHRALQKCFALSLDNDFFHLALFQSSIIKEMQKNSCSHAADMRKFHVPTTDIQYLRNVNMKENNCSKSENFMSQYQTHQNTQLISLVPKIEDQSTKMLLTEKHIIPTMSNITCNSCQEFGDIINYESFLKELQCNDKHLHLSECSSQISKACSLKQLIASFAIQNENASHDSQVTTIKEEMNEIKCAKKINNSGIMENENGETLLQQNILSTNNDVATESCSTIQPAHNIQSSQATLQEIKKRLQSLHKVLQMYQDASQYLEREESKRDEQLNETDASVSIEVGHEETNRCKTDTDCNIDLSENPRELQHSTDNCEYFDYSADSLSSLTGYSSNTSKMYQCASNIAIRNYSKESSRHCNAHQLMETDDFPAFSTTKLSNREQYSHFYSFSTSQASDDCINCENKYEKNACKHDIPDHACKSEAIKINEKMNASGSFHLEETISETVSERICCILSPRSFKNENIATQNEISSKFVEIFNNEEKRRQENMIVSQCGDQILKKCKKNMIISQSDRTPNDSDREEKSTALLLQEALHFKKVLLTRIDSAKEQSIPERTNENEITDESPQKYQETEQRENSDNFPSMILNIKTEKPIINDSCDQMNQHYVYLEMKQQRNQSVRSKQLNILTRHENEGENKDRICETASKYFSITDFAIHSEDNDNDDVKIGSNVLSSLKPPIYEKVISIIIPVDTRNRDEISAKDKNEKSMQMNDAVVGDIHANSDENLKKHRDVNDTNDNIAGCPPTTRKLENLVLERIKNIRDYIDTFLRNQNKAISKVRKALQYRSENDAMMLALRCSNEASHLISHKRLKIAISNHNNCIDQDVNFSNDSPDLLLKIWPNHCEVLKDDVLKYCSNICLRKDLEMFALMAPTKSEGTTTPEPITKLRKEGTDPSPSITFERPYEKNAKSIHKITDELHLNELHSTKCIELNQENDHTNKLTITDTLNMDSHEKQTQNVENKSSAIWSRYLFDSEKTDTKIIETVHEKLPVITNDNSISNSSSYFTNTTISSIKMDDIFSKSTTNLKQSRAASIEKKETEQSQAINKESNFIKKFPKNVNVESNELSSNLEYSNLKILMDSNFIPGESECDCSTSTRTLNENDIPCNLGMSPLHSSLKDKRLKIDDDSVNSTERKEIFADIVLSAPETESHSTRQFLNTHPQIKAKSDVSLNILDVSLNVPAERKNLNVNLQPKGSLSFLTHHDSLAHIQRTLHQSHINVQYDNKNKFAENKAQLANRSKSVIPSQRASTKSCIPISKNRLEPIRRARHQTHARSPTRGPLTVSCRENTFSKNHATEDKEVARRRSIPINRHLHTEEGALDLIELDMQKDIFAKNLERIDKSNTAHKDSNVMSQENCKFLCNENNMKPSIIDKKHSEKKSTHTECTDSKSNMKTTEQENTTHKTVAVISIMTDKDVQKNYPVNSFILKTEDVRSATDFLEHKNKLWTIAIERTEKEITAKPSIMDTCTSMSEIALKMN